MRLLGYIMVACLALAVLRMVALLVVILLAGLLVGLAITRPRQTAGFILFLLLLGFAERQPLVAALILGGAMLLNVLTSRRR